MRSDVRTERRQISQLADEAASVNDPETALLKLRELREELAGLERARVADALRSGSSFGAIAKAMGISRQAAHRRYRELASVDDRPVLLSSQARRAVHLARQEAIAVGRATVASEHLLLGVLRAGGSTSHALGAEGVTARGLRECLRAGQETRTWPSDAGRAVLQEAAEVARARHASYVEDDHIVLAALNAPDGGALSGITALGVTPAAVRRRLGC